MSHHHHHHHPHADDHHHGHHHTHGHGHHHQPTSFDRAFQIAIGLNSVFVVIEFLYGYWSNSTALLADAGHNLSDVLSLMLAWAATFMSRRRPTGRFTYGWRASSIWVAWINAALLLVACGAIAWEAIDRLSHPEPVQSVTMMVVATIGIAVNAVSAWLFARGSAHDINLKGAYLHLLADAAVSLGVVLAGWAMWATDWLWLDPLTSLVIVVVIIVGTWSLLKESVALAMAAVPSHIDLLAVETFLRQLPGVNGVHDLHIWGLSTTQSALTVHLWMPQGHPGDPFVEQVAKELNLRFKVAHSTLQIEQTDLNHRCALLDD
jgi:cobalt-zinc-cadmium efflux system protein